VTNWDQGYCPTCGAGLVPDATFCGNCGTSFAGHHDSGYENTRYRDGGYQDGTPPGTGYPEDPYHGADHPGAGQHQAAGPPASGYETAGYGPDVYGTDSYAAGGYGPDASQEIPYGDGVPEEEPATEGGDGSDRKSTLLLLFTGLLILGVTLASSNLLSAGEDDDGQDDLGDAVPAAGLTDGQVLLQEAGTVPEGAFIDAPELDLARGEDPEVPMDEVLHHVVTLPELDAAREATSASLAAVTVSGADPGAYAGYRGQGVCDRSVLLDAVAAAGGSDDDDEGTDDSADAADGDDADASLRTSGAAYATLLGVDGPDEVGDLVDDLTPVRLRFDTRVTQHTLTEGGESAPVQTILQAGTAVLVDDSGLPVISCNGANPLAAPDPVADDLDTETALDADTWAANVDQSWERFDPRRVVTLTSGADEGEREEFLFADIATTDLIERPVGSNGNRDLGPGDIVVTLTWDSPADLDLAVIDPNEALISANIPEPENSRGRLSEDANVRCEGNMTGEERVWWPAGDAPQGEYTIRVTGHAVGEGPAGDDEMLYEADCGGESAEFRLTVRLYRQDTVVHEGSVRDSETEQFTVTLGAAPTEAGPDADTDAASDESGDDAEGEETGGDADEDGNGDEDG
jgi:hypothetical protein